MSANAAFLTRLSHIVEQAVPDSTRAASATALVDAYRHNLCGRLGIVSSCRPTARAKQDAKDMLDDVRLKILKAELGAPAGTARIYTMARQRIEMARLALELRITDDCGCERPSASEPARHPDHDGARPDDARLIAAIRLRLRDRRAIDMSREAIRQSCDLLARFVAPSAS